MRGRTVEIVHFRVGAEFRTTLRSRPGFSSMDQVGAHTFTAHTRRHKPPFNECHAIRHTTFGIGSNGEFNEAGVLLMIIKGQQNLKRLAKLSRKVPLDFIRVGFRGPRPEFLPHF